jgi:methylamine dehydrogenase heavy chain
MHQGGGQETVEDPGTEAWAFDLRDRRRHYRMMLDEPATSLQLTADAEPLLIAGLMLIAGPPAPLFVHDARSGRKLREIHEIAGSLIQSY